MKTWAVCMVVGVAALSGVQGDVVSWSECDPDGEDTCGSAHECLARSPSDQVLGNTTSSSNVPQNATSSANSTNTSATNATTSNNNAPSTVVECESVFVCKPKPKDGEPCGNTAFFPPCAVLSCAPGLECNTPNIKTTPGTCLMKTPTPPTASPTAPEDPVDKLQVNMFFGDGNLTLITETSKKGIKEALEKDEYEVEGEVLYTDGSVRVLAVLLIPASKKDTSATDLAAELGSVVLAAVRSDVTLSAIFGDKLTVEAEKIDPVNPACPTGEGGVVAAVFFGHSNGDDCTVVACDTDYELDADKNKCEEVTAPVDGGAQALPALLQLLLPALAVVLADAAGAY